MGFLYIHLRIPETTASLDFGKDRGHNDTILSACESPMVVVAKCTWRPSKKASQPGGRGDVFETKKSSGSLGEIMIHVRGLRRTDGKLVKSESKYSAEGRRGHVTTEG